MFATRESKTVPGLDTSGREAQRERPSSLLVLPQSGEHAEVLERCRIAGGLAARGDVAQQPAHDLPRAGLRERLGEADLIGPGDGADLLHHVRSELLAHLLVRLDALLERDERDERGAF